MRAEIREKTVQVLQQARQRLQRGWCRKVFAETAAGYRVPPYDQDACRWCLSGAVKAAAGDGSPPFCVAEAEDELRRTIESSYPDHPCWEYIPNFNDEQDSVEPVLAVVDKTIERLQSLSAE